MWDGFGRIDMKCEACNAGAFQSLELLHREGKPIGVDDRFLPSAATISTIFSICG